MKTLGKYILIATLALGASSCSEDFLDTAPKDALSPATAWGTPDDAEKFLISCYDGWESTNLFYYDCMSDFGFDFHAHEGWRSIANGSLTTADSGNSFYYFSIIGRCNNLLSNIEKIKFSDEAQKKNIIAQAKFIRAYQYFIMGWQYGSVPIITTLFNKADEAKVAQNTEAEVRTFVKKELDECLTLIATTPSARGRIAKGAVLALRARVALYYGEWADAKKYSEDLMALGQYSLDPSYSNLFTVAGQSSPEIILAVQQVANTKEVDLTPLYNNAEGGWSSSVPTYGLVDTYEMKNGMAITESGSGYDATHPFKDRDPRMDMTLLYPGADYEGKIFNTLDKTINGNSNENYVRKTSVNNISKTGLTWRKYIYPTFEDMTNTNVCPIVFRYAEVLLTWAEAANELDFNANKSAIYARLNEVRSRVGMPNVDQSKYNTQASLRELIRRERSVEFAGEGIRRADIVRWKDAAGKMLAETVLNGPLECRIGTVNMSASVAPGERATINTSASKSDVKIEDRVFKPYMRYLPIPQSSIDKNPNLKPTIGY